MPNWCENELLVTGSSKDRELFLQQCSVTKEQDYHDSDNDDGAWDDAERHTIVSHLSFHKFVPLPNNQWDYNWCIANWGTKWDACDTTIDKRTRAVMLYFNTAWSPPEPVVIAMSKKFPTLTFKHNYWEMGVGFCGMAKYKAGELLDSSFDEHYRGSRGG